MGSRGPQPKPNEIKKLEGNPGKRAINENDPKPKIVLAVDPPYWLSDLSKTYWQQLMPMLSRLGVLTEADLPLFTRYCDILAKWKECRDFLATRDQICYPIFDGQKVDAEGKRIILFLKEYPHVSRQLKYSEHLLKIESHFGMSPSTRSRIIIDPSDPAFTPLGGDRSNKDPFDYSDVN